MWAEYLLICVKNASASIIFVFLKCWSVEVKHLESVRCQFRNGNSSPRHFFEVAVEIFLVIQALAVPVPSGSACSLSSGVVFCFWFLGLSCVLISGCFILDGVECCISILQRLRVWHWLSLGSDLCFRRWSNAGGERARGKSCYVVGVWVFFRQKS